MPTKKESAKVRANFIFSAAAKPTNTHGVPSTGLIPPSPGGDDPEPRTALHLPAGIAAAVGPVSLRANFRRDHVYAFRPGMRRHAFAARVVGRTRPWCPGVRRAGQSRSPRGSQHGS